MGCTSSISECNICKNLKITTKFCSTTNCKSKMCFDCIKHTFQNVDFGNLISIESLKCPFCVQFGNPSNLKRILPSYPLLHKHIEKYNNILQSKQIKYLGLCINCDTVESIGITTQSATNFNKNQIFICTKCVTSRVRNTYQCPQCFVSIEKRSGHNCVTCICEHSFCWLCKSTWGTSFCNFKKCAFSNETEKRIQAQEILNSVLKKIKDVESKKSMVVRINRYVKYLETHVYNQIQDYDKNLTQQRKEDFSLEDIKMIQESRLAQKIEEERQEREREKQYEQLLERSMQQDQRVLNRYQNRNREHYNSQIVRRKYTLERQNSNAYLQQKCPFCGEQCDTRW